MTGLGLPEMLKLVALGGIAGVLSGMFGIGGGLVIVPALVLMFGFDLKTATGTSLFVILLPTGLLGVLEYNKTGHLKVAAGLLIAIGVFVGAYFGAKISGAISATTMKRCYAIFLFTVATYFLLAPSLERKPGESADQNPPVTDMPAAP
jgi:uncharacterized membrane protein YfcA